MTNIEAKNALLNGRPVIEYRATRGYDLEYARVSAVIYRKNEEGKIIVSVELSDDGGNSVTITKPEYIRYKEES